MLTMNVQEEKKIWPFLKQISLIFLGIILLAKFLSVSLWQNYLLQCHIGIELIIVFISFSIFLLVWYTYEYNYQFNGIILLGSLIVGLFDILHLCLYSEGLPSNLATWYWLIERFVLIIVLFLLSKDYKISGNKYLLLLLSLFSVSFVASFLYKSADVLPLLYGNAHYTLAYKIINCIFIFLLLLTLYNLRSKLYRKDVIIFWHIGVAVVFAFMNLLCYFFNTFIYFYHVLAHLTEITCFFFLFKGVFVCAVQYPYQKIRDDNRTVIEILDELPLGFVIFDNKMRLFFANNKALEIWAYQKSDVYGLHHDEIVQKFNLINTMQQQTVENRGKIKDVFLDLRDKNNILHNLKVDYYKFTNCYLAIFEEVKTEQKCELLKLQIKNILSSIHKGVLLLDVDNMVFMCNNSSLDVLELKEEQLIGKNIVELYALLQLKENSKNDGENDRKNSIDNNRKDSIDNLNEGTITTLSGNKKILRFHSDYIKDEQNQIIGTIVLITDITFYRKESLKLRQKEKLIALGKIASGIVHEIKNPLTAIKGFSQLIKFKEKDEKIQEYACAIEQETEIINHFITDFLKFAKPSRPVLEKVDINKFIDSIKLIIDTNIFLSGIKVTYNLNAKGKYVMADANQLRQVILNIVKNAIEAIEDNGGTEIIISTKYYKQAKEISITIFNDGKAMTEEDKMMVGNPFYTTKKNGTGLGLSICFQLIKEHGGRIEIESEEGVGTGFIIYLPIIT